VIDTNAYPHLVEGIFRAAIAGASDRELCTLRSVCKDWRGRVDALLGRHLVLDAYHGRTKAGTYLHDGIRAPIASDIHPYHM
jgi:hypothetical protein